MSAERNLDLASGLAQLERELTRLKRAVLTEPPREALTFPLSALVLRVESMHLALPAACIQEVIPMVWVTPLPRAPVAVRGTINFRGQLVAVVDLHYALTGQRGALGPQLLLALVSAGGRLCALTADQLIGVVPLEEHCCDRSALSRSLPPFVRALVQHEGLAVTLLEPARLLAAGEQDLLRKLMSDLQSAEEDRP